MPIGLGVRLELSNLKLLFFEPGDLLGRELVAIYSLRDSMLLVRLAVVDAGCMRTGEGSAARAENQSDREESRDFPGHKTSLGLEDAGYSPDVWYRVGV